MAVEKNIIMRNTLPDKLIELLKAGPCRLEPVKDEDGNLLYVIAVPVSRGPKRPDPRRTQPL